MGREFELKYAAEPAQLEAIYRDFSLNWEEFQMETSYYDTLDRSLGHRRWTLRRRYENGVSVCTLKTPASGGARGEWDTVCEDIETAIPELCKLSDKTELLALTASGIEEVCGAKFCRRCAILQLENCAVELALDAGKLVAKETSAPLCEVEVELKRGSEDAAVAFAEKLAERYGLKAEPRSKYSRALALATQR